MTCKDVVKMPAVNVVLKVGAKAHRKSSLSKYLPSATPRRVVSPLELQ